MRYCGGKFKIRKRIAGYLQSIRKDGQPYWEPFVGGGWVLMEMQEGPLYASDANEALVFMWRRLQAGWDPPSEVTGVDYQHAKEGKLDAALTAFILIGCSFGGIWGASYAREGPLGERNFSATARRSLAVKLSQFDSPFFFTSNFLRGYPPDYNCLIYCDPPYLNTTNPAEKICGPFDHARFWDQVRRLESQGHTVVVSEYQAPDDFESVLEMPYKMSMRNGSNQQEQRVERLFRLKQT